MCLLVIVCGVNLGKIEKCFFVELLAGPIVPGPPFGRPGWAVAAAGWCSGAEWCLLPLERELERQFSWFF